MFFEVPFLELPWTLPEREPRRMPGPEFKVKQFLGGAEGLGGGCAGDCEQRGPDSWENRDPGTQHPAWTPPRAAQEPSEHSLTHTQSPRHSSAAPPGVLTPGGELFRLQDEPRELAAAPEYSKDPGGRPCDVG